MLKLTGIVGMASDVDLGGTLHDLAHEDRVETIVLDRRDMLRKRLRTVTDKGTDCAIALPRATTLEDGAVLLLEADRAIVIRASVETWLHLKPEDAAAALELGYHAGNLHWRVAFHGSLLAVALEGPRKDYLARLDAFLADGRITLVND
ncbi:MAG: urease accessory protein UreE [bacterium]|nr:urease accessory protein UreE [bacterium]